jgi:hypothetical protein
MTTHTKAAVVQDDESQMVAYIDSRRYACITAIVAAILQGSMHVIKSEMLILIRNAHDLIGEQPLRISSDLLLTAVRECQRYLYCQL